MGTLAFDAAPVPVRDDIQAALPRVWARIGQPGTWLAAEQRVAIAAETRHACSCGLCAEIKEALSPYGVTGDHDHLGALPAVWIDIIHRIIADPGRLARHWYDQQVPAGISDQEYVELVGVVVCTVGIDTFCRGIGIDAPDLPSAEAGDPQPETPEHLNRDLAWVPTLDPHHEGPLQKEFYPGGPPSAAHVRRALTYVPATARNFWDMTNTLYMNGMQMRDFDNEYRAISHAQIELVAGRVSFLNQCVY
jgi:hypothetical protein